MVGLFRDWDCTIDERRLEPGDLLALYTDGITETFNEAEAEFGEESLVESLRRHRHMGCEQLTRTILDEVGRFGAGEQHDDMTLIVAKCR